ncbi:MAG: LysM peptidoglycan-binding domain-containing protein [Gammaproteobacteria bacterium]|nr:LysM peptidoglycan-binding domain-containing protein [Gammaproteobacteria bacterium]
MISNQCRDLFLSRFVGVLLLLAALMVHAGEESFPKPKEIEADITFWKKVYTEISTSQGYIHDDKNLNVIYEIVELGDEIDRRDRNRLVDARKKHYRNILLQLARNSRQDLDEEAARVLALWPEKPSSKEFRASAKRLRFQLGQSDKFKAGLTRSGRWIPHIRRTMHREGLPLELAALPHVESSFNPSAYSFIGAAGMWQFTRSTGRRFMRVDHVVDERLDPFISSEAAAKLLKHNYSITGTWPLAITAYNHGASGMRRAIAQTGGTDIVKVLREYRSRTFQFASRNFYVAFLAAVEVHKDAELYFGALERDSPDYSQTVEVPTYIQAGVLAKNLGVELDVLKKMNPALRPIVWSGEKHIPKGFALRVPKISASEAASRIAEIDAKYKSNVQLPDLTYRVRRGDSLSEIADRFGVGLSELKRINNLPNSHFIRAGQTLRLPKSRRITVATRELVDGTYRVQSGDTLSVIADAFGVPEQQLLQQNNLRSRHTIYVGQVLNVTSMPEQVTETGLTLAEAIPSDQSDKTEITPEPTETAVAVVESIPEEIIAEVIEATEPTDAEGAEPVQPAGQHPALSADPANYLVLEDDRITIQAAETLGHYAEWLELRANDLRQLNRIRYGHELIIGSTFKLDFTNIDKATFEERRVAYHRNLQEAYFNQYRITGVEERKIKRGDSIWELTHIKYKVPLWLFLQYNPDIDLNRIKPGTVVLFPRIEQKSLQG